MYRSSFPTRDMVELARAETRVNLIASGGFNPRVEPVLNMRIHSYPSNDGRWFSTPDAVPGTRKRQGNEK